MYLKKTSNDIKTVSSITTDWSVFNDTLSGVEKMILFKLISEYKVQVSFDGVTQSLEAKRVFCNSLL